MLLRADILIGSFGRVPLLGPVSYGHTGHRGIDRGSPASPCMAVHGGVDPAGATRDADWMALFAICAPHRIFCIGSVLEGDDHLTFPLFGR